ncbi:MAG: hypothetical protein JSR36_15575 [Proteobacteria bacterium]|nr:hypothetical protein [Pseudomonadota bacterium]
MLKQLNIARSLAIVALIGLATGCGGGGGGSGGGGTGGGGTGAESGSFSVSPTSITVQARTVDAAPTGSATITVQITQAPSGTVNVYASGDTTHAGVDSISVVSSAPNTGTLQIQFKSPAALGAGTYTDTITLQMCFDNACKNPLSGGPATITTHYTVTTTAAVSVTSTAVNASATTSDASGPVATVPLTVSSGPASGVYVTTSSSNTGISVVTSPTGATTDTHPAVGITFRDPASLGRGTYTDQVTINVCADAGCTTPLYGSPIYLSVTYTITSPVLAVTSQVALSHDVIDATYSRALDAIVMVSSYPTNALYLYDVATEQEFSQALHKPPTAVTVGPSGLDAAVGHDALVTYVNLATLKQASPPAPIELNVTAQVFDLVLDGHGYVHVVPTTDQWVTFHSINIATNTETMSSGGSLRAGSHAKLQPGTSYIYSTDNDLSPSGITKWDVSSGAAVYMYERLDASPCGNLWFADDSVTTYSPCGRVLKASTVQAQDMAYAGQLVLEQATFSNELRSVDESSAVKEILGVQWNPNDCGAFGTPARCSTDVTLYDSDYLGVNGVYSLPSVTVSGKAYPQRGLFVFHSADGTQRFLVSMLYGEPNPATQYYVSKF